MILFLAVPAAAQEPGTGKFNGLLFGDYFYKLHGDSTGTGSQYSGLERDQQAFQIRRLYFGYERTFTSVFSAQLLLEGNDKTFADGKFGVLLKSAFVEWKGIVPYGSLTMGLMPTPTWIYTSERFWGYRAVEKTVMDYRGLGIPADLGVGLKGTFSESGILGYSVMVGNGSGQKPETNKYKKFYAALRYRPVPSAFAEIYSDAEPAGEDRWTTTLKLLLGYETGGYAVGTEAVAQEHANEFPHRDRTAEAISVFARGPVPGQDRLSWFARYDRFDADVHSWADLIENFLTVGLDYSPEPDVHLMPNLWATVYEDETRSVSPDADVVARMTFYVVFK
jgi:hypothetical protein